MQLNSPIFDAIAARPTDGSLDTAAEFLRIAAARDADSPLHREAGGDRNPPAAFGRKPHPSRIRVGARELRANASTRYGIARDEFRYLSDPVRHCTLRHFSGGADHEGRDFPTLDYPVEYRRCLMAHT